MTTTHRPPTERLDVRPPPPRPRLPGLLPVRIGSPSRRSCSGWTSSSTGSSTGRSTSRPEIDDLIPGNAHQAMLAVGVIEIVAGLVVAAPPSSAATWSPPGWPGSSSTSVLGDYYDVALRDFGLLLRALALARLATADEHRRRARPRGASDDTPTSRRASRRRRLRCPRSPAASYPSRRNGGRTTAAGAGHERRNTWLTAAERSTRWCSTRRCASWGRPRHLDTPVHRERGRRAP